MTTEVENNRILEDYERLKSNVNMFLNEVNSLTTDDIEFLSAFNNLKSLYFSDI
jgi:hypothetical protein